MFVEYESGIFAKGDCLDVMKTIPDNYFDMILCDLPYGTTQNKWDSVIPFNELWEQYKRIAKDEAAIVLTAAQPFSSKLVCSNLDNFKYDWVWKKSKITGVLNAKKQPVRQHEHVLIFSKKPTIYNPQGLKAHGKITKQGGSSENYNDRPKEDYLQESTNYPRSVLEIQSVGKTIHPTQKPVDLFEYLIKTYTLEGQRILDNCAGSGTTAIAAINTNRKWVCIEKDDVYFEKANERIKQHLELLCQPQKPD